MTTDSSPETAYPPRVPSGEEPAQKLIWLLPALVLVAGLTLAYYLGAIDHALELDRQRREATLVASRIASHLDRRVNNAAYLAEGYASLLSLDPDGALELFEPTARRLIARNPGLRNIAVAPGNVITRVYPLEGNETALGLDYTRNAEQWPAVRRAIEGKTIVVAGPVDLVQGGRGIIVRRPIFLDDASAPDSGRYWGLLSTVIEFDTLLRETLQDLPGESWALAIRGKDGLGEKGAVFVGKTGLFQRDPVIATVSLPAGAWQVAVIPEGGWVVCQPFASIDFLIGSLVTLVLAALVAFLLREQRDRLREYREKILSREQLEVSESRLRSTLLSIGDAVITTDNHGRIDLLNPVAEKLTGWSAAEAHGKPLDDVFRIINEETGQPAVNPVPRVLETGSIIGLANHTLLISRDGREIPIADAAAPVRDSDGNTLGAVLVFRDQSAERQAENQLRQAEQRLRLLIEHAPDAIVLLDPDTGRFADANAAAETLFGMPRDELRRHGPIDLSPPVQPDGLRTPEKAESLIQAALGGEKPVFEWTHRNKRGHDIPCEVRLLALELGGKRLIRGSIIDISRRKAAEARIRQLTRTYALLSEVNKAIVRESDTATLLQSICRIAVEQGGFRLAWVALASGDGSVRPAARSAVDSDTLGLIPRFIGESGPACPIIREALETGTYAIAPDLLNDPRAASWREAATTTGCRAMAAFPIIVNGRVRGTFNLYAESAAAFSDDERALLDELARDISFGLEVGERERARQRAETALRNSEERFREIAETIDDVFWVTDIRRTRFLYISPAFEKIWGRPLQDAHASTAVYLDAIHPDDLQKVRDAAAPDGDPAAYEVQYRVRRPDGAIRWILEKGYPTRDRSGAFSRVIGVARDITDFRELAEQLRHSQKLEALGHLAGGIAHDFNNILTALILQEKVARSAPNLPEEVRESLDEMRHAIDQATTLTRQLLLFSRRQTPQPRPLDLNESIRQLTRMLGRLIGEDIDLRLDLHPAPLPLRADPGMIDQVLVNLAVNARDAMPDGGTLHIKTDAIELSAPEAARTPGLSPGPYARLRIRDTGCGIEPELLEHIFDPFFTTKQPGEGTGLGLATVHSIVAQHHGHITVSSRPERGTTFTILLPLDKDPASGEPPATSAPEKTGMPSGSETVLLVEDDPKVRRLTERILRRYGYTVLSAENGRQALELWAAERDRIDLLLTDIVMPAGLSGTDLAQRIREDRPDLPVLFISGYDATHAGRNRQLDPGEHFLAKPFLPENLLQSVRRCLGRSAPGR